MLTYINTYNSNNNKDSNYELKNYGSILLYLKKGKKEMVIKTNNCEYSEYKIYPGHGKKFISKDGKVHLFLNGKMNRLYNHHIKSVKLTWT